MYRIALIFPFLILQIVAVFGQDTLRMSRSDAEAVFLKENLSLMAEKLNIPKAEAQLQQAKLWPNPTFTLDQVNVGATDRQTKGQEVVPPLWGDFGKNQQFAIELEQLIQTAGKRKKLIALERVNADKAVQYFQDLLRNLKFEFRNQLTELQYIQRNQLILEKQLRSIHQLTTSYGKQVKEGNIPQSELVRLKAQEIEIAKDMNDWRMQSNQVQNSLKTLMHMPPQAVLLIADQDFDVIPEAKEELYADKLLRQAKESRPDLKLADLEKAYSDKLYQYERAKRIPDFSLKAAYDRNGSVMLDFVGFGLSMDLPFFNRNQGNISAAELGKEQAKIVAQNTVNRVENDLVKAYQNYLSTANFRKHIEPGYAKTLDEMLQAYTRNFQRNNISMLEYLDFLEAYLANQKSILEANKAVRNATEELNYAVGTDIVQY